MVSATSYLWYNCFAAGILLSPQSKYSLMLQGIHQKPLKKGLDTMSNYITYEDRMEIENLLHNGKSFGALAKSLQKER